MMIREYIKLQGENPLEATVAGSHHKAYLVANLALEDGPQAAAETIWNFHVGGYQVPEKWLKDRRERALSADDIAHYQQVLYALHRTDAIMSAIDDLIPAFPLP